MAEFTVSGKGIRVGVMDCPQAARNVMALCTSDISTVGVSYYILNGCASIWVMTCVTSITVRIDNLGETGNVMTACIGTVLCADSVDGYIMGWRPCIGVSPSFCVTTVTGAAAVLNSENNVIIWAGMTGITVIGAAGAWNVNSLCSTDITVASNTVNVGQDVVNPVAVRECLSYMTVGAEYRSSRTGNGCINDSVIACCLMTNSAVVRPYRGVLNKRSSIMASSTAGISITVIAKNNLRVTGAGMEVRVAMAGLTTTRGLSHNCYNIIARTGTGQAWDSTGVTVGAVVFMKIGNNICRIIEIVVVAVLTRCCPTDNS